MKIYTKIASAAAVAFTFLIVGCSDIEIDNDNTPPNDPKDLVNNDYERRALDLTYGAYSALQLPGCMGYDYTSGAAWLSEAAVVPDGQVFVQSAAYTIAQYDNNDPYAQSIYRDTYILINRANNLIETVDQLIDLRLQNLRRDKQILANPSQYPDESPSSNISEEDLLVAINDYDFNGLDINSIDDLPGDAVETLFPEDGGYRGSPATLALYRGQGLFLRALGLFWATNTFNLGHVPMPLKTAKTVEESKLELTERSLVFNQIIRDLKLAKNLYLANFTSTGDNFAGLATWGAVTSLLGKVYLYNEQFEEAAAEFKQVIECSSCGYRLLTENLEDNSNENGEFNSESIFEVGYLLNKPLFNGFGSGEGNRQAESTRRGIIFGSRVGNGLQWVKPSHFITNLYKNEWRNTADLDPVNETETIHILYSIGRNDEENENIYEEAAVSNAPRLLSKRAKASLFFEDDLQKIYNATTREAFVVKKQGEPSFNHTNVKSAVKKFTDWELTQQPQTSGINERVIRLADVKLMYAEALLRQGSPNVIDAVSEINDVRLARGLVTLEELFAGRPTPPVAEFYGLELDEYYKDTLEKENRDRIANNSGPILPFELDQLVVDVLNGAVTLDENEKNRLNYLVSQGNNATLNLDWNRVAGSALDALGGNFPSNLLLQARDINSAEEVLDHLFNAERPAEFAFEGHGILYNDLRRRPGGALRRLEELSQHEYLDITPDAKLGNGEVASTFQALDINDNREVFFQDFVQRVRNMRGSRLKENLYLPIPLVAIEENSKLLSKPELLIRD